MAVKHKKIVEFFITIPIGWWYSKLYLYSSKFAAVLTDFKPADYVLLLEFLDALGADLGDLGESVRA